MFLSTVGTFLSVRCVVGKYVCMCVYMYVYVCVCMCVYACVYACVYTCVYTFYCYVHTVCLLEYINWMCVYVIFGWRVC